MQNINPTDTKKTTLLLIHNNPAVVKQLGSFLQSGGLQVLFAPSVLAAQKIITAKSPELIVLSDDLPDVSLFYNFYRHEYLSIPVLLLGSISQPYLPHPLSTIANASILQEPVNEAELLLRIGELLERSALRRNQAVMDGVIDAELAPILESLKSYRLNKNNSDHELSGIIAGLEQLLGDLNIYRAAAQAQYLKTDAAGRPLVLLVEDHALNRDYVSHLLHEAGYRVSAAASGAEAIRLAETADPGLVILDMTLPDSSGYDVYQRLRELHPGVPVIVLSGHPKSAIVEEHADAAFDDYLQKPVEATMLLERVASWLKPGLPAASPLPKTTLPFKHSAGQFHSWLAEFKTQLTELENNIRLLLTGQIAQLNRKALHAILNYSVYFANDAFKQLLRRLAENESNHELLNLCLSEITALDAYYRKLEQSL